MWGYSLRRGRRRLNRNLRGANPMPATGWSPVVITVP